MADRGPGPKELIEKRNLVHIQQIETRIAEQELQLLELDDQKERIRTNIAAMRKDLEGAKTSLKATKAAMPNDGNEGGNE